MQKLLETLSKRAVLINQDNVLIHNYSEEATVSDIAYRNVTFIE